MHFFFLFLRFRLVIYLYLVMDFCKILGCGYSVACSICFDFLFPGVHVYDCRARAFCTV